MSWFQKIPKVKGETGLFSSAFIVPAWPWHLGQIPCSFRPQSLCHSREVTLGHFSSAQAQSIDKLVPTVYACLGDLEGWGMDVWHESQFFLLLLPSAFWLAESVK